ncbi:MAG: hypothetical protein SPJ28_08190, partial [Oscillospiraceae bacterium]|nr:hypothetical protein [Oscillospiraceae bacterium]
IGQTLSGEFASNFSSHIHNSDKTQAFVDAAMAYAMVEAYANTEIAGQYEITTPGGAAMKIPQYLAQVNGELGNSANGEAALTKVLTMLQTVSEDDIFKEYLKDNTTDVGASATADLKGYFSAMNAINDNVGNINMDTYLAEGMSGDYMTGLLGQFNLNNGT